MTARWKICLLAACLCGLITVSTSDVSAQDAAMVRGSDTMELFDQPSPSLERDTPVNSLPSPAERRQALAWHQHLQRAAHIEAALRQGYHPSRPPGVITPSMTSRYPYYNTIFIPVFVDYLPR